MSAEPLWLPRERHSARALRPLALGALGVVGTGLVVGAASSLVSPGLLLAAIVSLVWLAATYYWPAVGLGVWTLAFTNTVPFINLDAFVVPGQFRPQDLLMVLLLVAAAAVSLGRGRGLVAERRTRWMLTLASVVVAWWALTVLRTWLIDDVPLSLAILFGRDLLYCPLAIVAALILLRGAWDGGLFAAILLAGAVVYATAYAANVLTGLPAGWILHAYMYTEAYGVQRGYQWSNWLVLAVLPMALWLTATARGWMVVVYGVASSLLALQVLLGLTRANYISLAAGLLVSLVVVAVAPRYSPLRFRTGLTAVGVLATVFLVAMVVGSARPGWLGTSFPTRAVAERVISIPNQLMKGTTSSDWSWTSRLELSDRMRAVLGSQWGWGLGFLHPSARYVSSLPLGNIRNTDLGMLGAVMTMGIVGLLALVAPIVAGLVWLVHSDSSGTVEISPRAMQAGIVALLVGALASSVTLMFITWPVTGLLLGAGLVIDRSAVSNDTPLSLEEIHDSQAG